MKTLSFVATAIVVCALSFKVNSQVELKQVIVLNEGPWGGPVTVGSYNPQTKAYLNFDTISARFATDVIVDSGFIYVAADTLLVKYDANTLEKNAQQTVMGIRELTLWRNQILVTRGDIGYLPSYFQSYDKNTLNLIYELGNLSGDAAEVKTLDDTAYIAVNDFGTMGKLAIIDLQNQVLNREIDLGPDGFNPEAVRIEGNRVITVNSMAYTNSSVTDLDPANASFQTTVLNTSANCGASATAIGNVYFQVYGEKNIGIFNIYNKTVMDTLYINRNVYGLAVDPVNGLFYAGITDYFSYGKVLIYDFYGDVQDSFDVNINPGTFAFDVRENVGLNDFMAGRSNVSIHPNPVTRGRNLRITNLYEYTNLKFALLDVFGKVVKRIEIDGNNAELPLDGLAPGLFFYRVIKEDGIFSAGKIVIE
ncbi:MAG: T9SS type A sorting domain-containing protein [Bacteroidetes bacterium]|nr:T9SS type A sorting domain-containing protein [Bacteroidota bacterium]